MVTFREMLIYCLKWELLILICIMGIFGPLLLGIYISPYWLISYVVVVPIMIATLAVFLEKYGDDLFEDDD